MLVVALPPVPGPTRSFGDEQVGVVVREVEPVPLPLGLGRRRNFVGGVCLCRGECWRRKDVKPGREACCGVLARR